MIKLNNGIYVIGFDDGYQFGKTANTLFDNGIYEMGKVEPSVKEHSLKYERKYYKVGEGRAAITEDKVSDENARLLAMVAIANELKIEGVRKADVILAVGLPFSDYGREKKAVIDYYLRKPALKYEFEGMRYDITIREVYVFPQCFAAISPRLSNMEGDYLVVDIGSKTTDVLYLRNGIPVESKSITIEKAMVKFVSVNPAAGVGLPKQVEKTAYHARSIDGQKTFTMEQIQTLLEASRETPIHMQVLFNVLMGLRRQEINGLKYSDIDYVNRTISVERQLGKAINTKREDFAPKTFTKQELQLKTSSSRRELPIPDYVFEAILEERKLYEKRRNRRKSTFQDLDYICCSSYGRPRSKDFHWKYYKKLLKDNGLPDIRWHDLRSTFCTLLLKNDFSPKAVSKLMGHAKEIISVDVYGDNANIIPDEIPELLEYMEEVLPEAGKEDTDRLSDVVADVSDYLGD